MLLKEILDDKLFNTPLLVKGYSNFKIFKDKKEFLLKVGLENKETKEIFATDNLQPEFLSLFPLRSVIHKGKIEKFEGSVKEIILNFDKVKYKKFKDIDNSDLKDLINKLFYFNNETYFAKYKNIVIPSLIIGQYFYFPNTNVRRLFRKEHIDALAYEVNCNSGHIVFKRNVKNEDITAIFAYLFECNEYFAESFSNAFSINIDYPLKENLELYSPTLFKFPQIDKELKLVVRGEKFNNVFIVYEILNFDFRQVIDLEKLEVSYLGNKPLEKRFLKTKTIASKIPANKKNISQIESYSKKFEEAIFESSEFLINKENQIKIEKVEPKKFNISNSQTKTIKEKEENKGISFGNYEDNKSGFANGNIGISKSDICSTLKDFIEKNFTILIYDCKNQENYAYFHFALIFKDGSHREYLITKLNIHNSATYVFSSSEPVNFFKYIPNELFRIMSEGKGKYANSLDEYSKYLMENFGICFHTSLKKKEQETIENWLKRLGKKLIEYNKCKGIN
ncbi:hypothetical protein [Nautilia sp.]